MTRPLDEQTARAIMLSRGLEPLEPYKRMNWPWRSRCQLCGAESSPQLGQVRIKQLKGCRHCRRHVPRPPAD